MQGTHTLYDLAQAIVRAFDFDFEHPFGFYGTDNPRKTYDAPVKYELFTDLGDPSPGAKGVKRTKVASVFTGVGQVMVFHFDYGDDWLFLVEVRAFGAKASGAQYPRVLVSRGEAPPQYPDDNDEEG